MEKWERGWYSFLCVSCLSSILLFSTVKGVIYNEPAPAVMRSLSAGQQSISLNFDPEEYSFLIYDCGSGEIQTAMDVLGIPYTLRNRNTPVTLEDLNDYNILIVGWKVGSANDTDGLDPAIIEEGIRGRVILTGHDTDWHTSQNGNEQPYAEMFLSQCIEYILAGGGTGLLAHGEPVSGFDWLPESWGIDVTDGLALETITGFTQDGINSGIFDGLTKENMSNWGNSFHNTFDTYGIGFEAFEMGLVDSVEKVITIAAQYNPLGLGLEKTDDVTDNDCRNPGQGIIYTISWDNPTIQTFSDVSIIDFLPVGVSFDDFVEATIYQPAPSADPNIIFSITDANNLDEITLNIGQSVRLYVNKQTGEEDIFSFYMEVGISDPNWGWIDNTEYDPNNPGTAEILAWPRETSFDYYGPGYVQPEGIQFCAVSFGNPIQDGNLASFVYTPTEPGYVVLSLVNYDTNPVTLEEIVIRQVDPNDPNNVPGEPNESEEVVFSTSSVSGEYDGQEHKVTWELGDVAPNSSGSVSFRVVVNYKAEPGINLHNVAEIYANQILITRDSEDTLVCCWDTGTIIYVDKTATGNNNGTNWTDAYTDLQDALYRAENTVCEDVNTIYVAQGEYSPGTRATYSFVLPDGASVYGGFMPGGCDFESRNPDIYPAILTGLIDDATRNETVVTMGDESLMSGFVIRDSGGMSESPGQGVYSKDVEFILSECTIEDNRQYGLFADNCDVELEWCRIENNGWDGIRHIGTTKYLTIENCQINDNRQYGIYDVNSISIIRNNVICRNGSEDIGYFCIWFENPKAIAVVSNNTIAYNQNEAIYYLDSDPNHVNIPNIQNCIIWYNNQTGNKEQFAGWKVYPQYSCVYDPNDLYGESETIDWRNNFSHKPDFAYPYSTDPNVWINIHLAPDSFCKNKGNPNNLLYTDQNDVDAEYRVADGRVDVGADEISCSNVYNAYDWNADGIVNYGEFKNFSIVWLAHDPNDPEALDPNSPVNDPNDPNFIQPERRALWYPDGHKYNFSTEGDSEYSIDVADLLFMLDDSPWLWTACWRHDIEDYLEQAANQQSEMMMSGSLESQTSSESLETAPVTPETTFSTLSAAQSSVEESSIEEFDPVAERELILTLMEDITVFIDAGGDDAEVWQEIKIILEQSLVDIEDMINDPNEI